MRSSTPPTNGCLEGVGLTVQFTERPTTARLQQLSGSYDETLKFMNLFETLDRLVNVTSFSVSGGGYVGDDVTPAHSVTLDLVLPPKLLA